MHKGYAQSYSPFQWKTAEGSMATTSAWIAGRVAPERIKIKKCGNPAHVSPNVPSREIIILRTGAICPLPPNLISGPPCLPSGSRGFVISAPLALLMVLAVLGRQGRSS